jgi:phenylacetate-CoA ligase
MNGFVRRALASSAYHIAAGNLRSELACLRKIAALDPVELKRRKGAQLKELLLHAQTASRFYQGRLPDEFVLARLDNARDVLPDLAFLSDADLQSGGADRSIYCGLPRRKATRRTAGTSGAPKRVELDGRTISKQLAVRAFFLESIGLSLGGRELRLWGRAKSTRYAFREFVLNRDLVSTDELWGSASTQRRNLFEGASWCYAYGYSSMVLRLAELWSREGTGQAPFEKVIFTAESMSEEQRSYAEAVFQRRVIGEYGSTETDILAFGCVAGRYHLVEPNFIFEAMSVPGESNAVEFAITDLNNFRTPLIRYRLGDLVDGFDPEYSCKCGLPWGSFSSVRGRTADRLVQLPSGVKLHAGVFSRLAAVLPAHGLMYSRFLVEERASGEFLMTLSGISDEKEDEARKVLLNAVNARFGGLPPGCLAVAFGEIPQVPGAKFSYFVRSSNLVKQR